MNKRKHRQLTTHEHNNLGSDIKKHMNQCRLPFGFVTWVFWFVVLKSGCKFVEIDVYAQCYSGIRLTAKRMNCDEQGGAASSNSLCQILNKYIMLDVNSMLFL